MEIMDGIHQITLGGDGSSGSHPTVSSYYVQGMDYGGFIDAGFPDEERTRPLLDYWRDTLGSPKTEWVFVTHRHYEHGGGVKLVKETTGAQVAVGAGDADCRDRTCLDPTDNQIADQQHIVEAGGSLGRARPPRGGRRGRGEGVVPGVSKPQRTDGRDRGATGGD